MIQVKNYICGQWVAGEGEEQKIYNAITGDQIGAVSVSYTHLDVYKRQFLDIIGSSNEIASSISAFKISDFCSLSKVESF